MNWTSGWGHRASLAVVGACMVFILMQPRRVHGEQLQVDFRRVAHDPLVDFTPAQASGDRTSVNRHGLRVQQAADRPGRHPPREIGAKMLISASGDFTARLDWAATQIEEPKEGWGQGLIFTVELDDPELTELQMSLIGKPGKGIQLRTAKKGRKVQEPIRSTFAIPFESGVFSISRKGDKAIFAVEQAGTTQELAQFECPTADMRFASVWCTRQSAGNTAGDYLLRTLTVTADSFFSYQTSRQSSWAWWQVALVGQIGILGLLLAMRAFRAGG